MLRADASRVDRKKARFFCYYRTAFSSNCYGDITKNVGLIVSILFVFKHPRASSQDKYRQAQADLEDIQFLRTQILREKEMLQRADVPSSHEVPVTEVKCESFWSIV
jgi:hypothetical protein